jgi:hypothetical protein
MPERHPIPAPALPIDHDGFVAGDNGPIPSPERIGTLYVRQGAGRPSRRVPVVRCGCGARVECHSHWASACACGVGYDRDGWRLSPASAGARTPASASTSARGPTVRPGPTSTKTPHPPSPGEPWGSPSPVPQPHGPAHGRPEETAMSEPGFPYGFPRRSWTDFCPTNWRHRPIVPRCVNSELGWFNQECGRDAVFVGTHKDGHESCYCAPCAEHGIEARRAVGLRPLYG